MTDKVNSALDFLQEFDSVSWYQEAFGIVLDYIIKLEEEIGEWIPVNERLPETNDIYLVSMNSYGLPTRDIDGYIQQTDKKWEVYGNKVIAWMPLPEPYKTETKIEQGLNFADQDTMMPAT